MASKTSYVRIAAIAAATVAVLFVMHARRAPRRQPAAAQQDGVGSDQALSVNWPLGVYSDNKEWLTFHELMVKELRDSEKEQAGPPRPYPSTPQHHVCAPRVCQLR